MTLQKNLLEYLEESAGRLPEKIAFTDEREALTFSALLLRSRRLGTAVAGLVGVCNRPAAILVDRTVASLVAFFGALQSGNYYVPLDRNMPPNRIRDILTQLDPALLLYADKDEAQVAEFKGCCPLLSIETGCEATPDPLLLKRCRQAVLDIDPAYVIFTSGSTGTPKGIVVSHRSVIDFTEWLTDIGGVTEADVMGNQAPFYFDLSVKDIYQTLKCGATTHIIPQRLFMFPKLLVEFLKERKVTALIWATSAFVLVANSGILKKDAPHFVNKVILGGEALHAKHLNLWREALPDVTYINLYGPTEVTVDCTYYVIDRPFADNEVIPIGRACENMEVLLLDEHLRPVPAGEPGEICARGIGLARGYYGDFEKTAAAFVQNPLNRFYPDLIYRTGDIGRLNAEGNIEFLTRRDGQIKHMGYRIELGDIEKAINSLPGVRNAVCLFDEKHDRILCIQEGELTDTEIIAGIRTSLPKYMFPNRFYQVDQMPFTPNGKIDRVSLRREYVEGTNP